MSVRVGAPKARLNAPDVDYEPPSHGPFRCDHCRWFDPGGGKGLGDEPGDASEPKGPHCEHPKVIGAAKVAPVQAGGCCKRFNDTNEEARQ
jgi:hypothetical protein